MLRSMFSAVSGLRVHQARMDVIGNNIANVNTVGFKSSRVTFKEIFSQTLKGASMPQEFRGGTNPQQIGLGVSLASIDTLHVRGSAQRTDNPTDLSIEGNGFFIVSDGGSPKFTRAGNFSIDALGNLVTPSGLKVMGWKATNGVVDTAKDIEGINIKEKVSLGARVTDKIVLGGNLDARTALNDKIPYNLTIYDSLGQSHLITFTFRKSASNTWDWTVSSTDSTIAGLSGNTGTIEFNGDGSINTGGVSSNDLVINFNNGANDITIPAGSIDFKNITQYANDATIKSLEVTGNPAGTLETFNIDQYGNIYGIYSNGRSELLATIALATFANELGLQKLGDNLYINTNNSGDPQIGIPGQGGRGTLNPGTLEMSNVDLSQEFTDMIITQRGFQANAKVITVSDEILQELVNLKR